MGFIDEALTESILNNFNKGLYDNFEPIRVSGIPEIDGRRVLDAAKLEEMEFPADQVETRLKGLLGPERGGRLAAMGESRHAGKRLAFPRRALEALGLNLLPLLSYGVLNGGSATSYADETKNRGFNRDLYELLRSDFERLAPGLRGRPKGLTPAFINPDGSPGPDFLELKLRGLLVLEYRARLSADAAGSGPFPLFQMTSQSNDGEIAAALIRYSGSPYLKELLAVTERVTIPVKTGVQPLIAAFTHSEAGRPKRQFTQAFGRSGERLALPGGHGQNFLVLKDIYRELYRGGKRFVMLCNVDNLGNLPDPVSLALLALSGKPAAFEFSFRTPVDVKGGVLVYDQQRRLNCADIGAAVSEEDIEARGGDLLFNCATGLFDLEYLCDNLDRIITGLPMRFSDQRKDAGAYSQAEQVTWEVLSLLDDFLVLGVDKYERFLAAKLLLENFMTSGLRGDSPAYPSSEDPGQDLRGLSRRLHDGLERLLVNSYGMTLRHKRWVPLPPEELAAHFRSSGGDLD